jgi:hypothetical protein
VYSFAAPPLTKGYQLTDGQQPDGSFPGLRTWASSPNGHIDLVARATMGFQHVKMRTLQLNVENSESVLMADNFTTPVYNGTATSMDPTETDTGEVPWSLTPCLHFDKCHIRYYFFNYAQIGHPELEAYHSFCKDTEHRWSEASANKRARSFGYRVIGRARIAPQQRFNYSDDFDMIHLYQDQTTNACVLTIEGSKLSANDWGANLNVATGSFCGFENVHAGLSMKLRHQTSFPTYKEEIRSRLPKCSGVTVTGHSQGGGTATLFAACANRKGIPHGTRNQDDFEAISWTMGAPELMPEAMLTS